MLFFITVALFACFAFVIAFGAPYLPTLTPQVTSALDMLNLKPGMHLLELGSGDGKVMLAAAQRGIHVTGYELNPILVLISRWRLRRYKSQTSVVLGNFWTATWPPADAIFSFNLQKHMNKLDTKIMTECQKPVMMASFAFTIDGRKPLRTKDGIFLYEYK